MKVFDEEKNGIYALTAGEKTVIVLKSALFTAAVAYFFYRSLIALAFLIPLFIYRVRSDSRAREKEKKKRLALEFKDTVLSVAASEKAGYSAENSFREAYRDVKMLYGESCMMCRQLKYIIYGLDNHIPIEQLLMNLGKKSGIEDIKQFGETFTAARKNGGNMPRIIALTADVISRKAEVERDIDVLLTSRRYEQKIMNLVPFGIIMYLSMSSPGFFDVLYGNVLGVAVMTGCLAVYMFSCVLSEKITSIEV